MNKVLPKKRGYFKVCTRFQLGLFIEDPQYPIALKVVAVFWSVLISQTTYICDLTLKLQGWQLGAVDKRKWQKIFNNCYLT